MSSQGDPESATTVVTPEERHASHRVLVVLGVDLAVGVGLGTAAAFGEDLPGPNLAHQTVVMGLGVATLAALIWWIVARSAAERDRRFDRLEAPLLANADRLNGLEQLTLAHLEQISTEASRLAAGAGAHRERSDRDRDLLVAGLADQLATLAESVEEIRHGLPRSTYWQVYTDAIDDLSKIEEQGTQEG